MEVCHHHFVGQSYATDRFCVIRKIYNQRRPLFYPGLRLAPTKEWQQCGDDNSVNKAFSGSQKHKLSFPFSVVSSSHVYTISSRQFLVDCSSGCLPDNGLIFQCHRLMPGALDTCAIRETSYNRNLHFKSFKGQITVLKVINVIREASTVTIKATK